jgi:uncharacterized repeat protein (TIGR01451 family)
LTDEQREVLLDVVQELRERLEERRRAPVQAPPPVQVPQTGDNFFTWVIAALGGAQPITAQPSGCDVEISMSASADPSVAQVGESVDLNYTVTNPGTVPLVDVQVEAALPDGLTFVSASSGGSVEPDSGYIAWQVPSGLDAGGTTTLSVSALIGGPGNFENNACSAGQDSAGNEVIDCASTIVSAGVPTPTATVTVTATPTATATITVTVTPTITVTPTVMGTPTLVTTATATPGPAQPIATPPTPRPEQPIAPTPTPVPPAPEQPIVTPPEPEPAPPIVIPPEPEPAPPIVIPPEPEPAPAPAPEPGPGP